MCCVWTPNRRQNCWRHITSISDLDWAWLAVLEGNNPYTWVLGAAEKSLAIEWRSWTCRRGNCDWHARYKHWSKTSKHKWDSEPQVWPSWQMEGMVLCDQHVSLWFLQWQDHWCSAFLQRTHCCNPVQCNIWFRFTIRWRWPWHISKNAPDSLNRPESRTLPEQSWNSMTISKPFHCEDLEIKLSKVFRNVEMPQTYKLNCSWKSWRSCQGERIQLWYC